MPQPNTKTARCDCEPHSSSNIYYCLVTQLRITHRTYCKLLLIIILIKLTVMAPDLAGTVVLSEVSGGV